MLTVSDIKQYFYCPRMIYFTYVAPVRSKSLVTGKMEIGKEAHEAVSALEERRTLRTFGLRTGRREFKVPLYSERIGLSGLLDMVIIQKTRAYPVEFKYTLQHPWFNHTCQLAAYALLLEDARGVKTDTGFVYLIPQKRAKKVSLIRAKSRVRRAIADINIMTQQQLLPNPSPHRGKCVDCELLRFCPDVDV
jgi:CRISPR-associated exonuclease Cas4